MKTKLPSQSTAISITILTTAKKKLQYYQKQKLPSNPEDKFKQEQNWVNKRLHEKRYNIKSNNENGTNNINENGTRRQMI